MNKANLERQTYQLQRETILERLQKFIRKPEKEEVKVEYFQSSDPLAKYLHS